MWMHEGGEDDDRGRVHLRRLLAAVPRLLPPSSVFPFALRGALHPAGLLGDHVARHELHHVQPYHLLLPERQVTTNTGPVKRTKQNGRVKSVGLEVTRKHRSYTKMVGN